MLTSPIIRSFRWLGRTVRQRAFPIPVLSRKYIRTALLAHGPELSRGAVCLDVGGGSSPYRGEVEAALDLWLYVSMEIAASDATTLVADATRAPLRSGSVDIAICMEVLQHIPDTRGVLAEIRRVLVPGGLFILSFPFFHGECDFLDFHRWSMQGMEWELRRCGLEVMDARRRGGAFFAATSILHWAAQHVVPGARKSWRFRLTRLQLVRASVVHVLALPTALMGWLALAVDRLMPTGGLYVGGMIVARRPPERSLNSGDG